MLDALELLKHMVERMCFRQNHPHGMARFCPKPLQPIEILDRLGTESAKETYQYRVPVGDCVDFAATSYSNVLRYDPFSARTDWVLFVNGKIFSHLVRSI